MVDAVVSFAVERLGDYLIQEAVFLQGVTDEVKWLKTELQFMKSFLKDAEEKQAGGDNRVREWVSTIRDIAYDTEDVLDKFILKVEESGSPDEKGFVASVKKYSCIVNKGANLYGIGKQIESLKKRVLDISRLRETYEIKNISDGGEDTSGPAHARLRQLRRATSYAVEEHVVGFEDDAARLLAELLKEEPRRFVITILGMGGLGKTTLARKLYHSNEVKDRFECFAWVSVSQDYRTQDLLQRIIKSFKPPTKEDLEMMEKMSEEDLERHLRKFLEGSRYLVVIDDVWEREAWESLSRAFPDSGNGSRVIITTREKDVAERADERTYAHNLRFLRPDESWELFSKKAFRNTNIVDEGLEMLGKEMAEKCGGLPLALVVLGGLLSAKKPHEWQAVREHLWRHLSNDSNHASQILELSFNNLPSELKSCFLYLGLFPEDFEIGTEKLFRLWVAEGFIPQDDRTVLEEVAEDYLNELIGRSLIQVAKISWGKVAACRVHDLLRDLVVEKAKELKFLHVYDGNATSGTPSSTASSCRRQAPHSGIQKYVSLAHWNPFMRSLLFFDLNLEYLTIEQLKLTFTRFRLLRVLDLQNVMIAREKSLPNSVGKLIHLRYLGLRNTYLQKFPPSIVNLKNLQTLDVVGESVFVPPGEMCKLKHLRHLIGQIRGRLQIDNLTELQTLRYVDFNDWIEINPEKLINLRELRMECSLRRKGIEFTLNSIAKLSSLRLFSLRLSHSESFPPLQPLSHCQHLLELRLLDGKIEKLPEEMHALLPYLRCLALAASELKQDPMPTLEKLPNLTILDLQYEGRDMVCTAKGFPRLEILQIYGSDELKEWQVEEGAMPMLRRLNIIDCSKLWIPERLRSIPIVGKWEFADDRPSYNPTYKFRALLRRLALSL